MKKEFSTKARKVGAKDNPSYVIPIEKDIIKVDKLDVKKKIKVVLEQ